MGEWSINTRFAFSQHWGLKNISFGLLPEAICNLHSCYKFCIRVTSFALVLKIKEPHSFLSQSELSNFFVYIIMGFNNIHEKTTQFWLAEKGVQLFSNTSAKLVTQVQITNGFWLAENTKETTKNQSD